VVGQKPEKDGDLGGKTEIILTLETIKKAPKLTGMTLEKAHEEAKKFGLTVKPPLTDADKGKNVVGQKPEKDGDLGGKTEIILTLESPPKKA